nr:immunoglobulin heavy chain junction region [Mus musculus]MBK4198300.1 immunoglobulin heavy chain junction region [Mus musculus]MBK4198301.1 immunoglobulin heavy chain junction region [Mus musculus]
CARGLSTVPYWYFDVW